MQQRNAHGVIFLASEKQRKWPIHFNRHFSTEAVHAEKASLVIP